jgi:hypothetical protein
MAANQEVQHELARLRVPLDAGLDHLTEEQLVVRRDDHLPPMFAVT